MRIFITGGGGFLGTALVKSLSKSKNVEIQIFDSFVHGFPKNFLKKKNVLNPIVGNIRNYYDLAHALNKFSPDVIYHLAAHITRPENLGNFRACSEINYLGTANLIEAILHMKDKAPKKVIFSSCESARNSTMHMGISKRAAEDLLKSILPDFGISVAVLRFAEVHGYSEVYTSSSVINFMIDNFILGQNIEIFGPNSIKDHIHLDDAVKCLELAVKDFPGKVLQGDVGTGKGISMKDLALDLRSMCKSTSLLRFSDSPYIKVVDSVSDISPLKDSLGFEASVDFSEAIKYHISKRKKELK